MNTEANAVITTSTVTTCAAPLPQVCWRTAEAIEVESMLFGLSMLCHGMTPRTPICMTR